MLAADEVECKKILVKTGTGKDAYYKYSIGEFFSR
ncbi:hypothetical protein QTL97_16960 [Sporosarcina thermotolerans]|uniref:Uncharacterized protein n=1 Tax=Sporosarcina thermotolerans TaxID=633404 RepID=A0AAW9AG43_9BACL|nr:hypothetical protein [Sporosarcina thermotolerans]MDW0118618.1 hypothetical protein [Sporosarcina thermotolerans]WHT49588.1 hypothetical protein QNH10_08825 [Sporosarcina thermotolerans]